MGSVVNVQGDTTYMQRFGIAGEDDRVREYPQRAFEQQVRAVCRECNGGWMSRAESEMKRYTEGMLLGRGRRLHGRAQAVLSMWATMKLLVGEHTLPAALQLIPAAHYRMVYEARDSFELPRAFFEAHISAYAGPRVCFYERNAFDAEGGDGVKHGAWLGTFAVGRLVFRVLGHTHPDSLSIGFRGPLAHSVHALWPPVKPFDWPSGPALDESGLDWFSAGPGTRPQNLPGKSV
jgi:hypothetical protein